MSATATETEMATIDKTKAQAHFAAERTAWLTIPSADDLNSATSFECLAELAEAAFDRAEEVYAEHDRMIVDLQDCVRDLAEGKLGPVNETTIDVLRSAVAAQAEHIRELQSTVEDLIAGGVKSAVSPPQTRIRLAHTHTLKDGWRLEGTTVEWDGAGNPDWEQIAADSRTAYSIGLAETESRREIEKPA